jgi:hypothetical protein
MTLHRFALRALVLALGAAWLGGCGTPSVHPIYTKDTVIEDERIVGSWRDEERKNTYTVSAPKDSVYRLRVGHRADEKGQKPEETDFEVRLVRLGGHLFIDAWAPASERKRVQEKHGPLFVATHMFARVKIEGGTVAVAWLKQEWARAKMNDRGAGFSATPLGDDPAGGILITSETEKLQAFLKAHAEDEDAWDTLTLRRVKAAGGE